MANRCFVFDGVRTPFAKHQTSLELHDTLALSTVVVNALNKRVGALEVDGLVFGHVVPVSAFSNIAREVVFDSELEDGVSAHSTSAACVTSYYSIASASDSIMVGRKELMIAGGADSPTHVSIALSPKLSKAVASAISQKGFGRLRSLSALKLSDLSPSIPAIRDRKSGLTMGEAAELMAREWGITRERQDEFSLRSHRLAAQAADGGVFDAEIVPCTSNQGMYSKDNTIRRDQSISDYRKRKPTSPNGSITAATSSPISDGAAAVLVGGERIAKQREPLAEIVDIVFTGSSAKQMLAGPAHAIPQILKRNSLSMDDIEVLDIHEAFAAQVLAVEAMLKTRSFCQDHGYRAVELNWDKTNQLGGSLAIGHPFAATGARQVTQTARLLQKRKGYGLCVACGMGGLGAAILMRS